MTKPGRETVEKRKSMRDSETVKGEAGERERERERERGGGGGGRERA